MKELKQSIIDDLVAKINASPFLIIAGYGGLTVAQFENLRKQLGEGGAEVHVTKNSFVKRAAAAVDYPEDISSALTGQTCVVIEAMKMLHTLTSPVDGIVDEVTDDVGDQVASHHVLVTFTDPRSGPEVDGRDGPHPDQNGTS